MQTNVFLIELYLVNLATKDTPILKIKPQKERHLALHLFL